jgi:hypothetical protein
MFVCCVFIQFRYSQETLETYNALVCMGVLETRIFETTQSPDIDWKSKFQTLLDENVI